MSTIIQRQHELTRWFTFSRILKCGLLLVILVALIGELLSLWNRPLDMNVDSVMNKPLWTKTTTPLNSIAPGELPGYTGWARPENTLARYFSIARPNHSMLYENRENFEFVVSVECTDCVTQSKTAKPCASRFFLRAYGPSVVPGTIISSRPTGTNGCSYSFEFSLYDPGVYTIEAVLTVSKPLPMEAFPLYPNQEEPNYEGYLLPGFPMTTTVPSGETANDPPSLQHNANEESGLCQFEDLIETSPNSALEKARWKVTGRVNERDYWSKTMNSSLVSTLGYMTNVNSLGINMEYRYVNDCHLIQEESLLRRDRRPVLVGGCQGPQEKLHIVYIGDSVMRVQKDTLEKLLKGIPSEKVEMTFLSLHGGYRKNQVLGPANVTSFLQDLQTKTTKPNENVVILFNTGLHDIHRLCGAEFRVERPTYLHEDRLTSFQCLDEYKLILQDFVNEIHKFPAALKVFQSTTAAWPKYGNYGIDWKQNAQGMVLVSDFCEAFNEIAFEVLNGFPRIQIMDGYWITYARPDNREIGDTGKKLSHPGVEVLSAMTRKWVMLMMDKVCLPLVV